MVTDLNNAVAEFFSKYKLEEISYDIIKKHFGDIKMENEYGGLIHAAVHNKYPEDKVLKFSELLLKNGVDVNLKGKVTGYSFIHLALYGYTEEDSEKETTTDYSYSTEFIIKLINLGKKYGLDVGIVDNDSDTLIHTALASEVYTGSVVRLIKALGDKFDISTKDGSDKDIYEALEEYKKEAMNSSDEVWLEKLTKEENDIKRLVEINKYNLDEINEELKKLQALLEEMFNKTDINYILDNYNSINELQIKLKFCIEKWEYITDQKDRVFNAVLSRYNIFLKKIISNYIKELEKKPDSLKIEEIAQIAEALNFLEIRVDINKLKEQYQAKLDLFKKPIEKIRTLTEARKLEIEVENFFEEKIKEDFRSLIENKKEKLNEEIMKIKSNFELLEIVNKFLAEKNIQGRIINANVSFEEMTEDELKNYNLELMKIIDSNKKEISQTLENDLIYIFNYMERLSNENVFDMADLFNILNFKITTEKDKLGIVTLKKKKEKKMR